MTTITITGHDTPEQAAAAVRNGRPGYLLTVRGPTGRWVAHGVYVASTKGDAITTARAAMLVARDASRVAVVDEHGQRLRVPVPQELRAKKAAPTP